jgi:lipopolysaccharide/colanic/teichoic acid biosynthesis glycosyltransferase
MPGPIFFVQQRIGKDGEIFKIYKFRTLKIDEKAIEENDSTKDAERMTPLGTFLRRWKIDELPQIYNVLVGDMSLVGPRPTVQRAYDEIVSENTRKYAQDRLTVKPGLTGLAQVNGNAALTWDERMYYDSVYVENLSLWLDLRILMKTVLVLLFGEDHFCNRSNVNSSRRIV